MIGDKNTGLHILLITLRAAGLQAGGVDASARRQHNYAFGRGELLAETRQGCLVFEIFLVYFLHHRQYGNEGDFHLSRHFGNKTVSAVRQGREQFQLQPRKVAAQPIKKNPYLLAQDGLFSCKQVPVSGDANGDVHEAALTPLPSLRYKRIKVTNTALAVCEDLKKQDFT